MRGARSLRCSTSGKWAVNRSRTPLYTPVRSHGAPDALGNRHKRPRATRTAGFRRPRPARENPRERGLFSIPAAAALPLVHRRTTAGRAGPFAQRIGPRPRAVREGNGLRRRYRSRRSGGRQAPSRQTARVLRGPIRSRRHLAAEGQLRAGLRSEFRLTHPLGSFRLVPPEPQQAPPVPNLRRARIAVSALAVVAAVIAAALAWRALLMPVSAPAQLFPLASYPGVEGPPALSPDGNLVAFAWSGHAEAGPTDIYVKAVESEALRRLTATPDSETSPAWSPDGHRIAFVRDGHGVFTMSQLGGAERQVSASGTHVAWAGDSKSVLIRDREGNTGPFGIYQVFLDTLERRRLTQAPVGAGDWRFEVSPDGSTLAFIRYEKVGIADLYVVPMGGGEPRRLSNWSATMYGLSWTPDGREIVYEVDEPPASRLWRIHANSATPARGSPIADIPAAAMNPSISRPTRGQPARLAFQTITRDVDLHLMDLDARLVNDTLESQPFSNSTRIEGSARFSPDGSRIAFASLRSGAPEIWVAGRDGSGLQQVTTLGASGVMVGGWSPDGTTDRVRSSSRRQHRRLSRRSRWRAPAPADRGTLHRRRSVVVAGRAVDLFRIDTRGSRLRTFGGSLPTEAKRSD